MQVVEKERRMESSERVVSDGGDDEEQHRLRLRALLHELVRKKGRVQAARALGLDPRTVGACMDGEGMSWRVREALERALQEGVGSAAEREQRLNQDLERRVEELEGWREAVEKELGGSLEVFAARWQLCGRNILGSLAKWNHSRAGWRRIEVSMVNSRVGTK